MRTTMVLNTYFYFRPTRYLQLSPKYSFVKAYINLIGGSGCASN